MPCEQLPLQINNLLHIKQIKPVEQPVDVSGREPQKLELLPGRLLKATVLDYLSNGKIILDIDGQQISAFSQTPLDKTTLWLEVKQGGETPILSLAQKKGAVQQFLKFILSSGSDLNNSLDLLNKFSGGQLEQISPELNFLQIFSRIIIDGNASPEKLIKLLHFLNSANRTNPPSLPLLEQFNNLLDKLDQHHPMSSGDMASLKKLTEYLEIIHDLNQQPGTSNQNNFFLYPCFFAGENGWGQWMFNYENMVGSADKAKNYQLNFFLDMSRIKEVHCQLLVGEQSLQGRFFCSSPEVVSHFNLSLPNLTEILIKLGYQPVTLSCRQAENSLMKELKEKLGKKAGKAAVSIVDIKA